MAHLPEAMRIGDMKPSGGLSIGWVVLKYAKGFGRPVCQGIGQCWRLGILYTKFRAHRRKRPAPRPSQTSPNRNQPHIQLGQGKSPVLLGCKRHNLYSPSIAKNRSSI